MRYIKEKLIHCTKMLKGYLFILYEVAKSPKTPWIPKIIVIFALAYALSPIDLIPDFIPILGYLDDLILLPILIYLAVKLIPSDVWDECRNKASIRTEPLPKNWTAALVIIAIWILVVSFFVLRFTR
ncbi:TPA: YkvA family protein [Legionella anisa]